MRIHLSTALLVAGASALVGTGIGLSLPAGASGTLAGADNDHSPGSYWQAPGSFPHQDHIFVIMMENTSYSDLLNPANSYTPYIQQLAQDYGLETDYYGVTHT